LRILSETPWLGQSLGTEPNTRKVALSDGEIFGDNDRRRKQRRLRDYNTRKPGGDTANQSTRQGTSTSKPNRERDRSAAAERRAHNYCKPKHRQPRKVYRRCSLCNKVFYTESEWQLHLHGRRHLAKSERNNVTFTCEVCGIEGFESSSHHRQHLTSKAHFRQLNQRKRSANTKKATPIVSTSKFERNTSANCGSESDSNSSQRTVRTP